MTRTRSGTVPTISKPSDCHRWTALVVGLHHRVELDAADSPARGATHDVLRQSPAHPRPRASAGHHERRGADVGAATRPVRDPWSRCPAPGRPRPAPRSARAGRRATGRGPARWSGRAGRRRSRRRRRSRGRTARSAASPRRWRTDHAPVLPSIDSRIRSACPLCRAYSSIMCTRIQRRLIPSPVFRRRRSAMSSSDGGGGDHQVGGLDEPVEERPQLLGRRTRSAVPVPVVVGVPVDVVERRRRRSPGQGDAEPPVLDVGHVLEHPAEGQVGRRQRGVQLLGVQALGLHPQGVALPLEHGQQRGALVGSERAPGRVRWSCPAR